MKRLWLSVSIVVLATAVLAAQSKTKPLEIWVVDVEGGKAALYVSPTGETALIDSGFPGARDLDRIMAAIADAGVKQIDYLVSTHYHVDHIGNVVELAKRIPVGTFVDHGPTLEGPNVPQVAAGPDGIPVTKAREQVEGFQAAYAELYGKVKHLVVKPGDRVPITGLDWRIVTSAGQVLKTPPLPGGGKPNPYCAGFTPMAGATGLNDPDDAQSVGSVIILGQFRALDFGDMWRTKELELMCPNNPIGTVDLYFASSHGAIASGSLPFVHAIQPRVAIMQNGTRKGGAPEPMQTILSSPGLEASLADALVVQRDARAEQPGALYRERRGHADDCRCTDCATSRRRTRQRRNSSRTSRCATGCFVCDARCRPADGGRSGPNRTGWREHAGAAPAGGAPGGQAPAGGGRGRGNATGHTPAYWLKVAAYPDGTFTITNPRNGFSKTYAPRTPPRPTK